MTMEPDDLERLVHRALADLPMPRAPRTFRPRVMAAVALPDVGHPWFTWPWPLQVAAVLLVVVGRGCARMGVADAAGGLRRARSRIRCRPVLDTLAAPPRRLRRSCV